MSEETENDSPSPHAGTVALGAGVISIEGVGDAGAGVKVVTGAGDAIEQPQETDSTPPAVSRIPSPSTSPVQHRGTRSRQYHRGIQYVGVARTNLVKGTNIQVQI